MYPIVQLIDGLINLLNLGLFIWCLSSWFPSLNRREQPLKTLDNIFRPILAPIQRVVPPIGNIDVSPFVLMICLGFVSRGLHAFFLN